MNKPLGIVIAEETEELVREAKILDFLECSLRAVGNEVLAAKLSHVAYEIEQAVRKLREGYAAHLDEDVKAAEAATSNMMTVALGERST